MNTKEGTVTATTTAKAVFHIDTLEIIEQSRKQIGFFRQNIVGLNPLENTPVRDSTVADEYIKMRKEGVTLRGRHLCSSS